MHDKQVRRRRAVLLLLVITSLILLTAYFGESPDSPLHSVQRGVVEVLSPIQEGASKVLSPVRDIAGWFSDTFRAKSQVDKLRVEVQKLTAELAQAQTGAEMNAQLSRELALDNAGGIDSYRPVSAYVISRDPTLWYATVEVDKGADDGVHRGDPVIGDGALVGKVTEVAPTISIVSLITDHSFAVTAEVLDGHGDTGILLPAVGNPDQLLLQYLDRHATIQVGQQVVTAGLSSPALPDLFPRGIPIGTVSSADQSGLLASGQVQVSPAADLRHLDVVQVLTRPQAGTARAQVGGG